MVEKYTVPKTIPLLGQEHIKSKGIFYIGGSYKENASGLHYMSDQMYVEVFVPHEVNYQYPIVFYHGAGQTGVNWLLTPDGRPGWADYFLEEGYVVYVIDQPSRGRSVYHPCEGGKLKYMTAENVQASFTYREGQEQWPGEGIRGDSFFDAFYASQVEYLEDAKKTEWLMVQAGVQLLEKIGPCILVTHSQAGPCGWLLADKMPDHVRLIVSLEPTGPPFSNINGMAKNTREYGIAENVLTYTPSVNPPEWFRKKESYPELQDWARWMQSEPAGKLKNLSKIDTLLLTAEKSYHEQYDYLTFKFLEQAGVPVEHVLLKEIGFYGNGHMFMMEKNNREIAAWVHSWIKQKILYVM